MVQRPFQRLSSGPRAAPTTAQQPTASHLRTILHGAGRHDATRAARPPGRSQVVRSTRWGSTPRPPSLDRRSFPRRVRMRVATRPECQSISCRRRITWRRFRAPRSATDLDRRVPTEHRSIQNFGVTEPREPNLPRGVAFGQSGQNAERRLEQGQVVSLCHAQGHVGRRIEGKILTVQMRRGMPPTEPLDVPAKLPGDRGERFRFGWGASRQ